MNLSKYLFTLLIVAGVLGGSFAVGKIAAGASGQGDPAPVKSIPFQGRLTDPDGTPLDGEFEVHFALFDQPAGGTSLGWSETLSVTARGGLINTALGERESLAAIDFSKTLYLGIRVDDPDNQVAVTGEPEMVPRVPLRPALFAINAHESVKAEFAEKAAAEVPLGTVLDFFHFGGQLDIPEGFEVCDGTEVSTEGSPLIGMSKPNFNTARFVRGVADSNAVGQTGGNDSATHSHTASSSSTGSHSHTLPASTGNVKLGGSNPGADSYSTRDDNQGWGSHVHLAVDGGAATKEGQHRHDLGGSTGSTGSHRHTITVNSKSIDNKPSFIQLLKIVRVK